MTRAPHPAGARAITALKRVSAYRTSDGGIYATRGETERAEAETALEAVTATLASYMSEGSPLHDAVFDHAGMLHAALSRLLKARAKVNVA